MDETTSIHSELLDGELVYVVVLYFKETGHDIIKWKCDRLAESWNTSREVNRLLLEGGE
jgi:hypothetical protein